MLFGQKYCFTTLLENLEKEQNIFGLCQPDA